MQAVVEQFLLQNMSAFSRRAVGMGCLVAIDSDAHDIGELDYLRWGVSQARRAWIEPESVVNTRSRAELLAWAAAKPERV